MELIQKLNDLNDNTGKNIDDLGFDNNFLDIAPKE